MSGSAIVCVQPQALHTHEGIFSFKGAGGIYLPDKTASLGLMRMRTSVVSDIVAMNQIVAEFTCDDLCTFRKAIQVEAQIHHAHPEHAIRQVSMQYTQQSTPVAPEMLSQSEAMNPDGRNETHHSLHSLDFISSSR